MRIYSPCHQDKAHTDWALTYTTTRHENAPDGHAGADFVDVSLGIIVHMAADTILAFHPLHHHGTTYCDCVHHSGVVFTFSKSIHDAISESAKRPDFTPQAVFTCAAVDHDENFQADDPMDDSQYVHSVWLGTICWCRVAEFLAPWFIAMMLEME